MQDAVLGVEPGDGGVVLPVLPQLCDFGEGTCPAPVFPRLVKPGGGAHQLPILPDSCTSSRCVLQGRVRQPWPVLTPGLVSVLETLLL